MNKFSESFFVPGDGVDSDLAKGYESEFNKFFDAETMAQAGWCVHLRRCGARLIVDIIDIESGRSFASESITEPNALPEIFTKAIKRYYALLRR
jgi:hypothetical protein